MIKIIVFVISLLQIVTGYVVNFITSTGDLVPLSASEDAEFLNSTVYSLGKNSTKIAADQYLKKYEVRLVDNDLYPALQLLVPITSCHDSTGGSGGDMTFSITIGLSPSNSISVGLTTPILNVFSLSGSFGVDRSYSISSSYTCNIPKGTRGQIWALPFAIVGTVQHRVVYVDKKLRKTVSETQWTKPYEAKVPSALSPMFSCRTEKYAACTIPVPKITIDLLNSEIPSDF